MLEAFRFAHRFKCLIKTLPVTQWTPLYAMLAQWILSTRMNGQNYIFHTYLRTFVFSCFHPITYSSKISISRLLHCISWFIVWVDLPPLSLYMPVSRTVFCNVLVFYLFDHCELSTLIKITRKCNVMLYNKVNPLS